MKLKKDKECNLAFIDRRFNEFYYRNIHYKLPQSLRRKVGSFAFLIKVYLFSRVKNIKLDSFKVQGIDQNKKTKLNFLFFGDEYFVNYYSYIFFGNSFSVKKCEKTFICSINKKITGEYDAIIVKTDKIFKNNLEKNGFLISPEWIEMRLDIRNEFDKIIKNVKKSAMDDVRKIKKNNFTYEITNDSYKFDYFYKEIYIPYLSNRHEKVIIPESIDYDEIKNLFENGYLLVIKDKNKIISGCIITKNRKKAYFSYTGVEKEGDYLRKGASSALYYYFIKWAKENNMDTLIFGGVRPFKTDGLYKFKKKWNMKENISNEMFGIICIKTNNSVVKNALKEKQLIRIKNNRLEDF
jgi:hypothetical protein